MTARDELFTLQLEQLKHDRKYHGDICVLPIHQRINHMALHFAKYSGRIAESYRNNDAQPLNTIITDTFIISLVLANILNIRVADHVPLAMENEFSSVSDLGKALVEHLNYDYRDETWLLKAVIVPTGRLSKACESLDHVDAYPYREVLIENAAAITAASIVGAAKREMNLSESVRRRLTNVERNLVFHGYV